MYLVLHGYPNKWKDLEHLDSMKSLVLKNDVQEMFKEYVAEHNTRWPDVRHMKKSLFYEITRNITGGGKKQCARSCVDYIKVNFHTDNFELVDKVIDVVAPCTSTCSRPKHWLKQESAT